MTKPRTELMAEALMLLQELSWTNSQDEYSKVEAELAAVAEALGTTVEDLCLSQRILTEIQEPV